VSAADSTNNEDEEEDILGIGYGIFWLAVCTLFISLVSDALADCIEQAGEDLKISAVFLATGAQCFLMLSPINVIFLNSCICFVVVLPIVGNVAEHFGAVLFAYKNNLDLSLGIAVGSATQIGLFVLPLLVLIGWCNGDALTLSFGGFEASGLFLTVVTTMLALKDGTSDWLMGICLIIAYVALCIGFWVDTTNSLSD
jgi:Ca2+:H+ antiporter